MTTPVGKYGARNAQPASKTKQRTVGGGSFKTASADAAARYGSADRQERQQEQRGLGLPLVSVQEGTGIGAGLFDVLNMPEGIDATDMFTMQVGTMPGATDSRGNPVNTFETVQYTVAAGLEWLRDLAVTNRDLYNSVVQSLYDANYLSKEDVRFGSYTSQVAQAFVEAAYDVSQINVGQKNPGSLTTFFGHLDSLTQGRAEAGLDDGSGAGPKPPSRVDQVMDEATLKETLHGTSRSLLGRALSDEEEAELVSRFRGIESGWNDSRFTADMAQFNGQPATAVDRPNAGVASADLIRDEFATEKGTRDLASYVGVMERMMGLGGTGIGADI